MRLGEGEKKNRVVDDRYFISTQKLPKSVKNEKSEVWEYEELESAIMANEAFLRQNHFYGIFQKEPTCKTFREFSYNRKLIKYGRESMLNESNTS